MVKNVNIQHFKKGQNGFHRSLNIEGKSFIKFLLCRASESDACAHKYFFWLNSNVSWETNITWYCLGISTNWETHVNSQNLQKLSEAKHMKQIAKIKV